MSRSRSSVWIASYCLVAVALFTCCATSRAGETHPLWSDPIMLGEDDSYDSYQPTVGIAGDGTALVAWTLTDPDEFDSEVVYVTVSDTGQSAQRLVHEPNSGMDRVPIISVGADGVPWLIWERYGNGYEQVVSHWDGDAWTTPVTVFDQGGRWDYYDIYAAHSGDVWVVRDSRPVGRTDRDIFARHWNGKEWQPVERFGLADKDDVEPVVTVSREGTPWIGWLGIFASGQKHIVYAASADSAGWHAPSIVDSARGNYAIDDFALLPDGRPILTWAGNGHHRAGDVEYAVYDTSGWEYGGLVNEPDDPTDDMDGPAQLASSGRELWAVWVSRVYGDSRRDMTASKWEGKGWGPEELACMPDATHYQTDVYPVAAVTSDGRVLGVLQRGQLWGDWDQDIYLVERLPGTAVNVSLLSSWVVDGSVKLAWRVPSASSHLRCRIWRAELLEGGKEPAAGAIPEDASVVSVEPVGECMECSFVDDDVRGGWTYRYWLEGVDAGDVYGPVEVFVPITGAVPVPCIRAIRPNPAGGNVSFDLVLSRREPAVLKLFTASGRVVRTLRLDEVGERGGSPSFEHTAVWNLREASGRPVASGVYLARLEGGGTFSEGRVVVIR